MDVMSSGLNSCLEHAKPHAGGCTVSWRLRGVQTAGEDQASARQMCKRPLKIILMLSET